MQGWGSLGIEGYIIRNESALWTGAASPFGKYEPMIKRPHLN